ncbi:nucleotide exchange factor GrpE [Pseudonocardia sp. WMMC193]|uniref:nucleotide exchange factor GrpE n=1 Tax=Pseudonocardia sp. WMMC193 TaxID=2911965 RepID=UPI001F1F8365|nr:nucleotide exchange factor GrpE [Pseudonocardia sp. WMMC193]MCF7552343.1 nucleotide exchange factor GrpE [Pseudonocardia sp. WMMC193]
MREPGPNPPSAPPEDAPDAEATETRSPPEGRAEGAPQPDGATRRALEAAEDRWRRAAADLDNLRKRYAREVARERENERGLVTSAFLPVLDTLDRALEHASANPDALVEGIRTLREQALAVVAGLGYGREDEPGVPFDPARHEVVGVVDADGSGAPPGAVAAVVRPGYGAPGRQLRPAAVTVAQRSEG